MRIQYGQCTHEVDLSVQRTGVTYTQGGRIMLTHTPCCDGTVRIPADRFFVGTAEPCPDCKLLYDVEFTGVSGGPRVMAIWYA